MHKLLNSSDRLTALTAKALQTTDTVRIIDLCSGSGGPMIEVYNLLRKKPGFEKLELILTDLYPNAELAAEISKSSIPGLSYQASPVNAKDVDDKLKGVRTMVGSFHHMKPDTAKAILKNARDSNQPICIYEISDNSLPSFLWWISLPMIFLMAFFITPLVRPFSLKQIVFTYLLPVIPFFFAWDGAVSNARTYTLNDIDVLLEGLHTKDYKWEKGLIPGMAKRLYLLGVPSRKL
ncbi:hypothetical protein ACFSJU_19365 [Paradesertivirga mongoliensis]|uniref:Methyltransferase domain-containing protein n=1 Tax=Paradesertivirga mongoliensis TaxID=2100740 RepID=A0ABW4ZSE1_9SPHI|nr:hypothetical protein [Pedobacter mongoliensis]